MGEKPFILKALLYPVSLVYGLVIKIRNILFDLHVLKSQEFQIPVISVGNITVGGTGKTPHIEYLIELLSKEYKLAVLSRGYKRKTSDFILADENTPVNSIGDEPWQIKKKYPMITMAVDTNRVRGIQKLVQAIPDLDIILLDDAFQHRYVKPGINILLIDYSRPLHEDHMLPYGWLRESPLERYRADVIIYTKSPDKITPINKRLMLDTLALTPSQHAFFTSILYKEPEPLLAGNVPVRFKSITEEQYGILLVAGIANPKPLMNEIGKYSKNVKYVLFPDHHDFTPEDLKKIQDEFDSLPGEKKIVITTEKDVARLTEIDSHDFSKWYYIRIKIDFHPGEAELFSKYVFHYVKNNNRNSLLFKKTNRL